MEEVRKTPECLLGSIVNPGEYWLISKLKSHVDSVRKLEKMLSGEMNQLLTSPDSTCLAPHCCIAVKNKTAQGYWQRGKIVTKLRKDMYKVFLVDSGCFVDTDIKSLQLIKEVKYIEVEPLAFKLHLYGIVPFAVVDDPNKRHSESWPQSAHELINNIFLKQPLIYVKKAIIVNQIVYGDLCLVDKPGGQAFSLSKLLCINGCGAYTESYFKRKALESDSLPLRQSFLQTDLNSYENIDGKLDYVYEWISSTSKYVVGNCEEVICERKCGPDERPENENINCDFDSGKKELFTNDRASEDRCTKDEVGRKPAETTSQVNESDNVHLKISGPEVKGDSGGSAIMNNTAIISKKEKESQALLNGKLCRNAAMGNNSSSFGIFALFKDSPVHPIYKFRNSNLSERIILNLEKEGNFNELSPMQQWAIPSILRGHDIIMMGGTKTGKSLAFILPLLSLLQDRVESQQVAEGNGPIAIILCSGSRTCESLNYICHLLLRNGWDKAKEEFTVRVETMYGNFCKKDSWVRLTNGCELLISTPHCLARLLKRRAVTNFERLEYIVLDEVDIIVEDSFLSAVKIIMYQSRISKDCQKIFCGERWTPEIKNLVNVFMKNHAFIGSCLEATIYANLKPEVILTSAERKSQIILDKTLDKIGKLKIYIACEHPSETMFLCDLFKKRGFSPLVAHSNMVIHDIKGVKQKWNLSAGIPFIICCDDVMHHLRIDDAEMLIHYSLPSDSKTNFGNRFSALMKNYQHISSEVKSGKKPKILILVEDQNHYQLPHIVDFLLRVGGKIPQIIVDKSQEISWRIEANKKDVPLCFNLLEFGECENWRNCNKRHAFIKEIDTAQVFSSGLVKFIVMQVHSVCHLSVRLIQYVDGTGNKLDMENLNDEITDKMREFYAVEENRRFIGVVEVDELCAVQMESGNEKVFERGRIVELKKFNKLNKVVEVLVKLVDTGELTQVSVHKLYELSEELKNYRPQTLDVFLCNLLPSDFDREWSEEAISIARSIFTRRLTEKQFWIGKIRLSLKDSLHLEPVVLCRFFDNVTAYEFCAGRKLLNQKVAVRNDKHLEKLRYLCEKANIAMDLHEGYKIFRENDSRVETVGPEWAFLDGEMPRVDFLSAQSASCFFVRMAKFRDLLEKLEKQCQKEGSEMKLSTGNKWNPKVGLYCLAFFDHVWRRGRIESMEDGKILIFFIDYGNRNYVDDLLPIPISLLNQLPAQAIECCLAGVNYDCEYPDRVLSKMHSFAEERIDLCVSVIGKSGDAQMTGGNKYQVNLLSAEGISLNRMLIEEQLINEKKDGPLVNNVEMAVTDSNEEEAEEEKNEEERENLPENFSTDLKVASSNEESSESGNLIDPCPIMNFSDEIFDDENAQLMLNKFMEVFFPGIESEKIKDVPHQIQDVPINGKENCADASEEVKRIAEKRESSWKWCTPQINWSQDADKIEMKFMLNNIETYKFDCSATHLLFRCSCDNKLYVFSLKLFGSINPQLTEVRVKPFHLYVSLRKLCPLRWPRLPMNTEKYWCINFDLKNIGEGETTYVEKLCRKAASAIERGERKEGRVEGEIELVPSTDSEDYSDGESSSSEEGECFI